MTDTQEFMRKGQHANFFNDLMKRLSADAEKQYSDYAQKTKPQFGNHPYWQMSTDTPLFRMEKLTEELREMLFEPDEESSEKALDKMRACKKKAEEIMVQALLAYICVGTFEGFLINGIEAHDAKFNDLKKANTNDADEKELKPMAFGFLEENRRLKEENKKLREENEKLEGELYGWKYGV